MRAYLKVLWIEGNSNTSFKTGKSAGHLEYPDQGHAEPEYTEAEERSPQGQFAIALKQAPNLTCCQKQTETYHPCEMSVTG